MDAKKLATDERGWPVRIVEGMRLCARPSVGHYGNVEEFRIDGYCSCECRDMHEVETELAEAHSEVARLRPAADALRELEEWLREDRDWRFVSHAYADERGGAIELRNGRGKGSTYKERALTLAAAITAALRKARGEQA